MDHQSNSNNPPTQKVRKLSTLQDKFMIIEDSGKARFSHSWVPQKQKFSKSMIQTPMKHKGKFLNNCNSSFSNSFCDKSRAKLLAQVLDNAQLEDELHGLCTPKASCDMLFTQANVVNSRRVYSIKLAFSHGWFDNWKWRYLSFSLELFKVRRADHHSASAQLEKIFSGGLKCYAGGDIFNTYETDLFSRGLPNRGYEPKSVTLQQTLKSWKKDSSSVLPAAWMAESQNYWL